MQKQCAMCNKVLEIVDWYAFIRTKYCPACAAEMKRMQDRDRMREIRRLSRERKAQLETTCKRQREEIELLRAEIISLRESRGEYVR